MTNNGTVLDQKRIPLGEALRRLNTLQGIVQGGFATTNQQTEYDLILEALDRITLELGFDCDLDGVPDTVNQIQIFQATASTGCCRLVDLDQVPDRSKMKSSRG